MKNRVVSAVAIGLIAVVAVVGCLFAAFASHQYWNLLWVALIIAWLAIFFHTISSGHRHILQALLKQLTVPTKAHVLSFSAGRLEDLRMIASQLTAPGKVTGVANWQQKLPVAKQTLAAARLADRVDLVDSGMTNLPLPSQQFDYVIIDAALHNVTPAIQRGRVLQEAARVLTAHGTLVIIDNRYLAEYERVLTNLGLADVQIVKTGFNGWWGGPWLTSKVLLAKRSR